MPGCQELPTCLLDSSGQFYNLNCNCYPAMMRNLNESSQFLGYNNPDGSRQIYDINQNNVNVPLKFNVNSNDIKTEPFQNNSLNFQSIVPTDGPINGNGRIITFNNNPENTRLFNNLPVKREYPSNYQTFLRSSEYSGNFDTLGQGNVMNFSPLQGVKMNGPIQNISTNSFYQTFEPDEDKNMKVGNHIINPISSLCIDYSNPSPTDITERKYYKNYVDGYNNIIYDFMDNEIITPSHECENKYNIKQDYSGDFKMEFDTQSNIATNELSNIKDEQKDFNFLFDIKKETSSINGNGIKKVKSEASNIDSNAIKKKVKKETNNTSKNVIKKVKKETNYTKRNTIKKVKKETSNTNRNAIKKVKKETSNTNRNTIKKVKMETSNNIDKTIKKVKMETSNINGNDIKKDQGESKPKQFDKIDFSLTQTIFTILFVNLNYALIGKISKNQRLLLRCKKKCHNVIIIIIEN